MIRPVSKKKKWKEYLEDDIDEKYFYRSSSKIYQTLMDNIKSTKSIYQYRRGIVRKNKSRLCPCLTATMGTGGHNVPIIKTKKGIRKLTPRECFNFQGYESDFILPKELADSHLYKQAGNSVTVKLIYRIAKQIVKIL